MKFPLSIQPKKCSASVSNAVLHKIPLGKAQAPADSSTIHIAKEIVKNKF